MGTVIGIDLGTTNAAAAFYQAKSPEIVLTSEGSRLLPSVVAFSPGGDHMVGEPAKSQLITNPLNTVSSIKRLMGKRFSEVAPYLYQFHYKILEGEDDTLKIQAHDMLFSPEEISAFILRKIKESAEQYLNDTVNDAIITVPAYFNDSQRQATKDAGEIAGLNVLRIINEPTAASLAFSLDLAGTSKAVVFDFGGGTIDISVLEIKNDVIKVLATAGDTNLGGNDLDIILTDYIVGQIQQEHNIDLADNKLALQRIRDAAENAKKELSEMEEHEINLPFIADTENGPIHFSEYIERSRFEKMIEREVERTIGICRTALLRANLTVHDVDEILLVGGSTRIPLVQRMVKEFFGHPPNKKVNPDEIVAMGAAIQGAILEGVSKDILLLDVTPLSLGVKTFGGAFTRVIEASTTIPTNRSMVFSTAEDDQEEVEINVYQGEREIAEENKLLGKFTLTNIKPAPAGIPRIEVTFNININGILTVSAIDLSTGSKNEVVVTDSGLLSKEEIEKLKQEGEKFKKADLRKKQLIKRKNAVLNRVYIIKKHLAKSDLDPEIKKACEALIERAESVLEREDPQQIGEVFGELSEMSDRLEKRENEVEVEETATASPEDISPISDQKPGREMATQKMDFKILKTDVLNFIYTIEEHINNFDLEKEIVSECTALIEKANNEIEDASPAVLLKLHRKLAEVSHELSLFAEETQSKVRKISPTVERALKRRRKWRDDDTHPFNTSKDKKKSKK